MPNRQNCDEYDRYDEYDVFQLIDLDRFNTKAAKRNLVLLSKEGTRRGKVKSRYFLRYFYIFAKYRVYTRHKPKPMIAIFIIFLIVNIAVLLYFYKEAFVVRSNKSGQYKRRFVMMTLIIAGALVLAQTNLKWACILAGVPASAAVLFVGLLALALFTHKGPWR